MTDKNVIVIDDLIAVQTIPLQGHYPLSLAVSGLPGSKGFWSFSLINLKLLTAAGN
jgi:hypothetical protein